MSVKLEKKNFSVLLLMNYFFLNSYKFSFPLINVFSEDSLSYWFSHFKSLKKLLQNHFTTIETNIAYLLNFILLNINMYTIYLTTLKT